MARHQSRNILIRVLLSKLSKVIIQSHYLCPKCAWLNYNLTSIKKYAIFLKNKKEAPRMKTMWESIYEEQRNFLGKKYKDAFRSQEIDPRFWKSLLSHIKQERGTSSSACIHPPLLTVIPNVFIKEDILKQTMREHGHEMPHNYLVDIRTSKRERQRPYVLLCLQNGILADHPHTINFLEKIFFYMYTGKFPGDISFQKIIFA